MVIRLEPNNAQTVIKIFKIRGIMMKYLIAILIGILICAICISISPVGLFGQKQHKLELPPNPVIQTPKNQTQPIVTHNYHLHKSFSQAISKEEYDQRVKRLNIFYEQQKQQVIRNLQNELKTLSDKYATERKYIEGLRIPADQKRQKLLQLNNKYELAAITVKSKIRPNVDNIDIQRQKDLIELQRFYNK